MSRLRRHTLSCVVCAALAGSGSEAAANGRGAPPSAAPSQVSLAPATLRAGPGEPARVRWRFRSASPLAGPPAVSADGRVYVASVEGYVHALEPDGRFRWSYGLRGVPLGAPAIDTAGRVYVATREGHLYALDADGQLGWASRARGRFASGPVWAGGAIYLLGREGQLYGVPASGGAPSLHELGAPASAGLAHVGAGLVAIGTSAGAALLYQRNRVVAQLLLRAPLLQPLLGGSERWFAVTSEGLSAIDASSHELLWSAPARRAALSADQRSLVVEADRELRWLSPQTGEVLGRAPSPGDVSAAPVVTNDGLALMPMVSGDLRLIDPRASGAAGVEVGPAPLWAPVYDEAFGRVTVAAGGAVAAFDLAREPIAVAVPGGGT
jgi:outer membrane protein assembly factor BamB